MNKPLTAEQMRDMPAGWFSPVIKFSDSVNNGSKCRRARMHCRDFDPVALREGRKVISLRLVEKFGKDDNEAGSKMEAFKDELRARFPGGFAVAENRAVTLKECVDDYMETKVRKLKAPRTVHEYELIAKAVLRILGPEMTLDQVKTKYIREQMVEPGRKRSKERVGLLRRAINCARESGTWESTFNPCDAFSDSFGENVQELNGIPKIKRSVIPDEKIVKLLEQVVDDPQWLAFYYLAIFAGPRTSAVLNAPITAYDPKEGTLFVKDKNGDRFIVLGHAGRALLERLIKHHQARGYTGEWLFPAPLGGRLRHTNFQRNVFKPHMLAAELAVEIAPGPARNNPDRDRVHDGIEPEFTMHGFRHTVSTRDRDIMPPFFLDAQIGHKNDLKETDPNAVRLRYAHPQDRSLFPKRREYAELVDERVKALLPKKPRHLQAAS